MKRHDSADLIVGVRRETDVKVRRRK